MGLSLKAKLLVPDSRPNTAPSYALGFKTISLLLTGRFNDIWLSVMSIFSEHANGNSKRSVSYIAKRTYDNYVITPRNQLTL